MNLKVAVFASFLLLSAIAISNQKVVLAIGCDTQERISNDISGSCGSFSTRDLDNINRERYQVCIAQQMKKTIAKYKVDWIEFYTQQQEQPGQTVRSKNIPMQQLSIDWEQLQGDAYSVSAASCQ